MNDNRPLSPEEKWDLYRAAFLGLMGGDLKPLAVYIRAVGDLDPVLANDLASQILNDVHNHSGYVVEIRAARRGFKPYLARMDTLRKKLELGLFVEKYRKDHPSEKYDAVIAFACEKFKVERSTAAAALAYVESIRERGFPSTDVQWAGAFEVLEMLDELEAELSK